MSPRLIPRDQGFYPLFAEQAAVVAKGAEALAALLQDYRDPRAASAHLRELEHAGDELNHTIMRRLDHTFVTPFGHDEIQALASGLDDILDLTEEIADKCVLYSVFVPPVGAADQAALLARACAVLVEAIGHLVRPAELGGYPVTLHGLEKEGDLMVRELIGRLFAGQPDVRQVLVALEIYRGLEEAIDRTDRVGRILDQIGIQYGGDW